MRQEHSLFIPGPDLPPVKTRIWTLLPPHGPFSPESHIKRAPDGHFSRARPQGYAPRHFFSTIYLSAIPGVKRNFEDPGTNGAMPEDRPSIRTGSACIFFSGGLSSPAGRALFGVLFPVRKRKWGLSRRFTRNFGAHRQSNSGAPWSSFFGPLAPRRRCKNRSGGEKVRAALGFDNVKNTWQEIRENQTAIGGCLDVPLFLSGFDFLLSAIGRASENPAGKSRDLRRLLAVTGIPAASQ